MVKKSELISNAFDNMLAAEKKFRAERTPEAQAAYNEANRIYIELKGPQKLRGYGCRAGKRQAQEQAARTAESIRRNALQRQYK